MKSRWVRSAVSAAFSCFLAFLLVKVLGVELSSFFVDSSDSYMKSYYDVHNGSTRAVSESEDIVIVDIGAFRSRKEIAAVLDKIIACKPLVVGLDVFMPENDELRADADSAVVSSLFKADFPFVSPCVFDETAQEWEFPFYVSELDTLHHKYASPVAFDFFEQYSLTDPRSSRNTFAYEVAAQYERVTGRRVNFFDGFTVNYRNKDFYPVSDMEEINNETIGGKVILVGDCQDYRDIHTLPFKIMGSTSIPGVANIAYTLNSLLSTGQYCDDHHYTGMQRRYNRPFYKCRTWMNILISYVLCFLFSLVVYLIPAVDERRRGRLTNAILILLPMLLTILAEIVLLISCYEIITSIFLLIPNIFLFVGSVLFVGTCNNLVNELFD